MFDGLADSDILTMGRLAGNKERILRSVQKGAVRAPEQYSELTLARRG